MPEDVYYDRQSDVYVYYSARSKGMVRVPGDVIREMKADYSSQKGRVMTINEMARKYEMPRAYFKELKTKLGWTHDSSIYTPEELVDWGTDHLRERATEARERKAMLITQRDRGRNTRDKVRRWDALKGTTFRLMTSGRVSVSRETRQGLKLASRGVTLRDGRNGRPLAGDIHSIPAMYRRS
jgi:hypothetical protein